VFSAVTLDRALSCEMEMKFHLPERAERDMALSGPRGDFLPRRHIPTISRSRVSAPTRAHPAPVYSFVTMEDGLFLSYLLSPSSFDGVIRVWDEFYRTPFQENAKSLVFMRLGAC
jgi:hypothetical protein